MTFNEFLVEQFHRCYLGRELWVCRLETGATVAEFEHALVLSDEAQERGEVGFRSPGRRR
ncbi:MAG: hypothetical protein AAFQ17_06250 [Pseudomonadota bacterium]